MPFFYVDSLVCNSRWAGKISCTEKKIQKAPLPSASLMHHQERECRAQWWMRSFQGTAIPDPPEQWLAWDSTEKHNLLQVLNGMFISWTKYWNSTALFQSKSQCIFLIFLLEKWLENAKSRGNMESNYQPCLRGNRRDAQPAWLLPNCREFSTWLLWQACDPALKWLSRLHE